MDMSIAKHKHLFLDLILKSGVMVCRMNGILSMTREITIVVWIVANAYRNQNFMVT